MLKGSTRGSHSSSSSSSDGDHDTRPDRDQDASTSNTGSEPGSGDNLHLRGREARRAERAKGEQHAALARLREGAGRAVRAGHQDEEEVEVVAEYMRQAQQLEQQLQREEEEQHGQAHQRHRSRASAQRMNGAGQPGRQQLQQQEGLHSGLQQAQERQPDKECSCAGDNNQGSSHADDMSLLVERQMQEESAFEAGRSGLRRGQVQTQLKAETRGTLFLEAVWTPFKAPEMLRGGGGPGFGCGLGPPLASQRAQQQGKVDASDLVSVRSV